MRPVDDLYPHAPCDYWNEMDHRLAFLYYWPSNERFYVGRACTREECDRLREASDVQDVDVIPGERDILVLYYKGNTPMLEWTTFHTTGKGRKVSGPFHRAGCRTIFPLTNENVGKCLKRMKKDLCTDGVIAQFQKDVNFFIDDLAIKSKVKLKYPVMVDVNDLEESYKEEDEKCESEEQEEDEEGESEEEEKEKEEEEEQEEEDTETTEQDPKTKVASLSESGSTEREQERELSRVDSSPVSVSDSVPKSHYGEFPSTASEEDLRPRQAVQPNLMQAQADAAHVSTMHPPPVQRAVVVAGAVVDGPTHFKFTSIRKELADSLLASMESDLRAAEARLLELERLEADRDRHEKAWSILLSELAQQRSIDDRSSCLSKLDTALETLKLAKQAFDLTKEYMEDARVRLAKMKSLVERQKEIIKDL
jgi:hypothetical protein